MTRAQLIKLIHVARREAGIDDETYRAKLAAATGKTSCRDLDITGLNKVIESFRESGFKAKSQPAKPRTTEHQRTEIIGKIRAVWHEMHRHGFLRCGSDAALNQYVQRMTSTPNGGAGIARLDWVNGALAMTVVETLKKWHAREMRQKMESAGIDVPRSLCGYVALAEQFNTEVSRGNIAI